MSTQNSVITLPPVTMTPWEKLDSETPRAYIAFTHYRDTDPSIRSLREASIRFYGDASSGKIRQIEAWSAKFAWVSRAAAWDLRKDQEARETQLKSIQDMNERHNKIAEKMLMLATNRLNDLMNNDDPLDKLTPADLVAIVNSATKLERTSRGQPSEIIEERGKNVNVNIDAGGAGGFDEVEAYKLTPEQLREAYAKIQAAKRAMNNDDGN